MPSLNWIGKDKVVNHHHEVPYKVLNHEYTFSSILEDNSKTKENVIIKGDNLEALKSLLPEYTGRIKCIYIDPPYNTGNEKWVYNDNVNDPKIKKWLGQVVGKEEEDLSRHDKWLCMMYPRLNLLKNLLSNDGVLFVSIGEDEVTSLRFILDEIFGRTSRLATFTWRTDGNFDNQAKIKNCHEYILMYSKKPELFEYPPVVDPNIPANSKLFRPEIKNTIVKNGPKNPVSSIVLPIGFPADFDNGVIKARTNSYPHFQEDCQVVGGKTITPVMISSGWSSLDLLKQYINSGFQPVLDRKKQQTVFKLTSSGTIEVIKTRNKPSHVITALSGFGSTQSASSSLYNMKIKFDYPKPVELISYIISMIDYDEDEEFIVLDSFAGSGTTAQAVLNLNLNDKGNRKFILIELLEYAETITAERVRSVMNGYGEGEKRINGTGGGFDFYSVGEPLFLSDEVLNESVGLDAIRNYVAYAEGIPTTERIELNDLLLLEICPYLLGMNDDTAWIFNYEINHSTSLDMEFLSNLRFGKSVKKPSTLIVYADRCLLSNDFMSKYGIIFKKIPRDITRF